MRKFLIAASAIGYVTAVTPVEKVTELLTKLSAKIEEEGQAEAVAYDKFACFCKDQADDKVYAIEKSDEKIEKLNAKIEELTAEIEKLDAEVAAGNAEIERLTKESEEETKLRADAHEEFKKAHESITTAITAVKNAIVALQESRPVDTMLLQTALVLARSAEANQVKMMLNQDPSKYDYHSNDIIALLQKLLQQFKAREEKIWTEESTEKHAFNKVEQARQFEIKTTTEAVATASASSAKKSDTKSKATDSLNTETDERNSDQAFLDDLTKQCEDKAKNFDQRSTTRTNELKALSEATALLKGKGGEKYTANKRLNLIQNDEDDSEDDSEDDTEEQSAELFEDNSSNSEESSSEDDGSDMVFIQRSMSVSSSVKNTKVFNLLRDAAHRLKSSTLSNLALKLKADHFVKVRQLIKDLITRLEDMAKSEATHKEQCDKDMKAAITQRDESQASMEAENAAITTNEVTISDLNTEIADLKQAIMDLKRALKERTELRSAERDENEKTIADAKEGKNAIESAVSVLKEFYGETSLISIKIHKQDPVYKAPGSDREGNTVKDLSTEGSATFEEEYHGNNDAASGIFGLLNVIQSDYERTIEETGDMEKLAQEEFEQYESDTNTSLDEKASAVKDAEKKLTEEKEAMAENKEDLADATEENKISKEKLVLLKGECVDDAISHEERVKRREQEIDSLKEALNILEEMSFLQKRN